MKDKIHVMTPNELESLPDGAVVWLEIHEYDNLMPGHCRIQPLVMYDGIYANNYSYVLPDELRAADNVQLTMRCWSHRPTIETMDKEPWIIHEEWIK